MDYDNFSAERVTCERKINNKFICEFSGTPIRYTDDIDIISSSHITTVDDKFVSINKRFNEGMFFCKVKNYNISNYISKLLECRDDTVEVEKKSMPQIISDIHEFQHEGFD